MSKIVSVFKCNPHYAEISESGHPCIDAGEVRIYPEANAKVLQSCNGEYMNVIYDIMPVFGYDIQFSYGNSELIFGRFEIQNTVTGGYLSKSVQSFDEFIDVLEGLDDNAWPILNPLEPIRVVRNVPYVGYLINRMHLREVHYEKYDSNGEYHYHTFVGAWNQYYLRIHVDSKTENVVEVYRSEYIE